MKSDNISETPVIFIKTNEFLEEIIMNNPLKLNSLTFQMFQSIHDKILPYVDKEYLLGEEVRPSFLLCEDKSCNVIAMEKIPKIILLYSTGGKSFSSGGSLSNLYEYKKAGDYAKLILFYDYELSCDYFLHRMSPILISIWEGYVMGGGVGISINSKIRIATDDTVFAMPETSIGYFPDVGAGYFLTRIFNNEASIGLFCGLTGHRLKGKETVMAGVATHFVKKENLNKVKNLIREYSYHNKKYDIKEIEELIEPFCEIVFNSKSFYFENSIWIKEIFIFDTLFHIYERLEQIQKGNNSTDAKRLWAKEIISILNRMSPQSLLIFFEYAKISLKFKDILESYEVDRKLYGKLIYETEFFEGIRAALIDKDKNPNWNIKSLSDIKGNEDFILSLFN